MQGVEEGGGTRGREREAWLMISPKPSVNICCDSFIFLVEKLALQGPECHALFPALILLSGDFKWSSPNSASRLRINPQVHERAHWYRPTNLCDLCSNFVDAHVGGGVGNGHQSKETNQRSRERKMGGKGD